MRALIGSQFSQPPAAAAAGSLLCIRRHITYASTHEITQSDLRLPSSFSPAHGDRETPRHTVHWEACAEAEKEIAMAKRESRGKWNVVCVACKVDSYCLGACDKFGGSLNRNSNRNSWQHELNEPAAVIAQSPSTSPGSL